jgi:hypothetical protein
MENDRSTAINIGGEEYRLILTTRATKEIGARYGGLDKLGEKLMKERDFSLALDEIIWLIVLLANQSVMIHNIQHKDDKRELLTDEMVELLTTPVELSEYKAAITDALFKGMKRNVESEDTGKNQQAV